MKKVRKIIIPSLLFISGIAIGTVNGNTVEAGSKAKTISTSKVTIEYFDVNKDTFDIIVTPKKGYNISSEWDLKSTDNYRDLYLVGMSKQKAQAFHKKNMKGIKWTWDK